MIDRRSSACPKFGGTVSTLEVLSFPLGLRFSQRLFAVKAAFLILRWGERAIPAGTPEVGEVPRVVAEYTTVTVVEEPSPTSLVPRALLVAGEAMPSAGD
jgi:hypothetical protein